MAEAESVAKIAQRIVNAALRVVPRARWANVTQVDPLRIQFPGEDPLPFAPDTVGAVDGSQRVLVLEWAGRSVVLGQAGGAAAPTPLGVQSWRGKLGGTVSHSNNSYRSIPLVGDSAEGELATPAMSGDCLTGLVGVFRVSARLNHAIASSGRCELSLMLNPNVTSVTGTTSPTGTLLDWDLAPANVEAGASVFVTAQVRLVATDTLMLFAFQNSGYSKTIPVGLGKTWLEAVHVGE